MKTILFPLTDSNRANFNILINEFSVKINALYKIYSLKNINPEAEIKKRQLQTLDFLKIRPDEKVYLRFVTDSQYKLFAEMLKQCLTWKIDLYECEELEIEEKLILNGQIQLIKYLNKIL